jgi:hypothetical protein
MCWTLPYPRWSNCRGPIPPRWQASPTHLQEPRKNAERMAAIKKQSAPRKTRCLGEACVLIALSFVAILTHWVPKSLCLMACLRTRWRRSGMTPKNAGSRKPGASLQGGYAPPRRPGHRNDEGHRGVVAVWTGSTGTLVFGAIDFACRSLSLFQMRA